MPGRPPDLVNPPEGCRFAARCPYRELDNCGDEPQQLREIRPGHLVRSAHSTSERAGARTTPSGSRYEMKSEEPKLSVSEWPALIDNEPRPSARLCLSAIRFVRSRSQVICVAYASERFAPSVTLTPMLARSRCMIGSARVVPPSWRNSRLCIRERYLKSNSELLCSIPKRASHPEPSSARLDATANEAVPTGPT
ncbi:MAG: hypothetical protein ACREI7_03980 [Myxococcota bacterium]